jgi:hypothetical protein
MQTACHRCGAVVEEGTAFCPQCGAAQIRVSPPAASATPPLPPGTPAGMQPPVAMGAPGELDWGTGFRVAAIAGLVAGIPSGIPGLSIGCCIWVLAAGAMTVKLYQRQQPAYSVVTAGMGARLGAVAGIVGYFAFLVISFLINTTGGRRANIREAMLKSLRDSAANNPDPNAQQVIQWMSSPGGMAFVVVLILIGFAMAFLIFGLLGGVIGASVWGRKQAK